MSAPDSRPERMYRRDRPLDPDFEPSENLFRRCRAADIFENKLLPARIKFYPAMSVNREKYSQPADVLYPDQLDWGVARFEVRDVPSSLESLGGVIYEWRIEHVPEEDNYAHSEVRTYKNGQHSPDIDPPSLVKKEFRQILSDRAVIVIEPQT